MKKFPMVAAAVLIFMMGHHDVTAQRASDRVVRGVIRGAMLEGLIFTPSRVQVGAPGYVPDSVYRARRRAHQEAMYQEARARAYYRSTAQYRNRRRANFHQSSPRVLVYPVR